MRKLILISACVSVSILASVSVRAGESRNLTIAVNDEPKSVEASKAVATTKPDDATTKPESSPKQASRPNKSRTTRRESDEAKARRIAARYGVYW
jgi:hypothetical protein